jgi:hypothetical protein
VSSEPYPTISVYFRPVPRIYDQFCIKVSIHFDVFRGFSSPYYCLFLVASLPRGGGRQTIVDMSLRKAHMDCLTLKILFHCRCARPPFHYYWGKLSTPISQPPDVRSVQKMLPSTSDPVGVLSQNFSTIDTWEVYDNETPLSSVNIAH